MTTLRVLLNTLVGLVLLLVGYLLTSWLMDVFVVPVMLHWNGNGMLGSQA